MRAAVRAALVALVVLASGATRAEAEARRAPVHFSAGKNAVTIIGAITGDESVEYLVPGTAGRVLSVAMETSNAGNYFNVTAPGGEQALFNGAIGGNAWRGPLSVDGEYTVEVYLMRNAARRGETAKYTLDIAVGAPTAAVPVPPATYAPVVASPVPTARAEVAAPSADGAKTEGPSFDCAKAQGPVETAICKDDDLATLDRTLAEVFAAAGTSLEPEDATIERDAQRAWLKTRNACGVKPKAASACVRTAYESRIAELQVKSGSVVAPIPVDYTCGKESVRVYFYRETQVPAAVVNVGATVQDFAVAVPAASGAKYQGKRLELWTKGETATLTRAGGAAVSCRQEP